jgi:hypothetical protein
VQNTHKKKKVRKKEKKKKRKRERERTGLADGSVTDNDELDSFGAHEGVWREGRRERGGHKGSLGRFFFVCFVLFVGRQKAKASDNKKKGWWVEPLFLANGSETNFQTEKKFFGAIQGNVDLQLTAPSRKQQGQEIKNKGTRTKGSRTRDQESRTRDQGEWAEARKVKQFY